MVCPRHRGLIVRRAIGRWCLKEVPMNEEGSLVEVWESRRDIQKKVILEKMISAGTSMSFRSNGLSSTAQWTTRSRWRDGMKSGDSIDAVWVIGAAGKADVVTVRIQGWEGVHRGRSFDEWKNHGGEIGLETQTKFYGYEVATKYMRTSQDG